MFRIVRATVPQIVYRRFSVGFQIYPPPTTPPEPAPPDHHIGPASMMRPYKGNIVSASQSSLDDITCKWFRFHLIFVDFLFSAQHMFVVVLFFSFLFLIFPFCSIVVS